jgi:hypothetical protein
MGLFSSLFVFTLLRDIVLLIASAFATAPQMLAFTRLTRSRPSRLPCWRR